MEITFRIHFIPFYSTRYAVNNVKTFYKMFLNNDLEPLPKYIIVWVLIKIPTQQRFFL